MATDPTTLEAEAKCISKCIAPGDQLPVLISLFAQIAGVSLDPTALVAGAKCISKCIAPGDQMPVLISLLAQILDATQEPEATVGEISVDSNAVAVTMTNQNQYYPITAGWVVGINQNVTPNATAGTLTIENAGIFETLAAIGFTSPNQPNTLFFGIFKNGTLIADHVAITWTDTVVYPNTVTVVGIDNLAVGDVLDVRVQCTTAAGVQITVTGANFNCFLIGV